MCVTMKPMGLWKSPGKELLNMVSFASSWLRSLMKKPKWERNNMHYFGNKDLMKPNPGNVPILKNARFMQEQFTWHSIKIILITK